MDRLDSMSTFVAAVEAGSLSAAGRRLGMPLATVSRKVSELEAHLGTRLLGRTSRRLVLTDAGRAYHAACTRILEEIGEAERAVAGEYSAPRGEMTVTAPIVFGRLHVLPIATAFLEAFPEVDLRLSLADRVVSLVDGDADVAVRIGALPDSSLVALRVGTIRQVVCASPAYLARHGMPETPADLARHDSITFEGLMSRRVWSFADGKATVAAPVRSRLSVNTAEAAIDAAVAGTGLTRVLSYQIADRLAAGTLVIVLKRFELPPMPVSLVYPDQGRVPQKVRAFLDFVAPPLKARLAECAAVEARAERS